MSSDRETLQAIARLLGERDEDTVWVRKYATSYEIASSGDEGAREVPAAVWDLYAIVRGAKNRATRTLAVANENFAIAQQHMDRALGVEE